MADSWLDSLTGRGPPQPQPAPGMGPRLPGVAEQLTGFLRGLGLPETTARQTGALAPFTPPGAAFEGGQSIGQGITEGNPMTGLAGALQVGLSALPLRLPGPAPRPPGLPFTAWDVERFLQENGARNVNLRQARSSPSTYVDFGSRTSPQTVRVPGPDLHPQPPGAADSGRLIDTARAPNNDWAALQSELLRRVEATTTRRQRKAPGTDPLESVRRGMRASISISR